MKVPYLSASRLRLAQQCMFSYGKKYDPDTADDRTIRWKNEHRDNMQAAKLGNNIHNALEEWRRPNPKTGKVRRPLLKKLLDLYDIESGKNEVDFNMYEDGKEMIKRWFEKRGARKVKVLAVEQAIGAFNAPYKLSNGTPIFGFIDLVLEHPDGSIELLDYKSQRKPIKQEEADSDVQAGVYLSVARELWPDRPIRFTFDLLRYGTVTTIWSDDKIDSFKTWLKGQYEWIQSVTEPVATIGDGCKWCPFIDICPTAQDLILNGSWDLVVGDDPTSLSQDEMLTTLASVKAAQSILAKKRAQMQDAIKNEWFNSNAGGESIETDNWKVSFDDRIRTEYIPSEVQRIIGTTAYGQVSTISKAAVERILPILSDNVVDEVKSSAITKPYRTLNVRRKHNDKL